MSNIDEEDDARFWARLQHILNAAVASLSAEDKAARVEYCRSTGRHGVTAFRETDGTRFEWGGRPLAVVDRSVFEDDAYLEDLAMTVMPAAPDDASTLDGRAV